MTCQFANTPAQAAQVNSSRAHVWLLCNYYFCRPSHSPCCTTQDPISSIVLSNQYSVLRPIRRICHKPTVSRRCSQCQYPRYGAAVSQTLLRLDGFPKEQRSGLAGCDEVHVDSYPGARHAFSQALLSGSSRDKRHQTPPSLLGAYYYTVRSNI